MMLNSKWNLKGQKALITGGTKGIGFATAEEFLNLGAEVIIVARHSETVHECIQKWKAQDLKAHGLVADISQEKDRMQVLELVQNKFGALDVLVNNVGTNTRKPTVEYSEEEIGVIFNTNLISAYALCRLFYSLLKANQRGCIINVSSIAGLNHMRSGSPYGMTKAAMNQMTRNLAVEWGRDAIRVNAVAPGFTKTPLTKFWQSNESYMKELLEKTPLGRMGDAQEMASAIAFLAMPVSSFTTGQCLIVDGGLSTNLF